MYDKFEVIYNLGRVFQKLLLSSYYKETQPAFTCSNLTIKTLEQGVKYV